MVYLLYCHTINCAIKNKIISMHFYGARAMSNSDLPAYKEFWRQEVNSFPSKYGEEDGDKNFWMK